MKGEQSAQEYKKEPDKQPDWSSPNLSRRCPSGPVINFKLDVDEIFNWQLQLQNGWWNLESSQLMGFV